MNFSLEFYEYYSDDFGIDRNFHSGETREAERRRTFDRIKDLQKEQRRNPDQDRADWAIGSSRQDTEQEVDRRIMQILATNRRRFEDLDLEPTLSRKRVQARFRRLALVHHPDKGGNPETFRNLKGSADKIIQHLTDFFMRFPGKNPDAL